MNQSIIQQQDLDSVQKEIDFLVKNFFVKAMEVDKEGRLISEIGYWSSGKAKTRYEELQSQLTSQR